jgi:hypothetical protein
MTENLKQKNRFHSGLLLFALLSLVARETLAVEGVEIGAGTVNSQTPLSEQHSQYALSAKETLEQFLSVSFKEKGGNQAIRKVLAEGLEAARSHSPEGTTLTWLATVRGLELNSLIDRGCEDLEFPLAQVQCLEREADSAVYYLRRHYDFIINAVSPLDTEYYIPWKREHPDCEEPSCLPENFLLGYKLYLAASVESLFRSENLFGTDRVEARVSAFFMNWLLEDIESTPYANEISCLSAALLLGRAQLTANLAGDQSYPVSVLLKNSRQILSATESRLKARVTCEPLERPGNEQ